MLDEWAWADGDEVRPLDYPDGFLVLSCGCGRLKRWRCRRAADDFGNLTLGDFRRRLRCRNCQKRGGIVARIQALRAGLIPGMMAYQNRVAEITCTACGHVGRLDPGRLARRIGDASIPEIRRRLRCRSCGAAGMVTAGWVS